MVWLTLVLGVIKLLLLFLGKKILGSIVIGDGREKLLKMTKI